MKSEKHIFPFLLAALWLFMPAVLPAQPGNNINQTDAKGRKQGRWIGYHANDTVRYIGTFKNDIPVDTLKRFDEDGYIQARLIYRKGDPKVADAEIFYTENGGLMAEGKYVNQQRDSVWLFYDGGGRLVSRENYHNGKRNGQTVIYYPNGSVSEKITYVNGIKDGLWEQYFEDGTPKLKATVENGVEYKGVYVSYYPDGTKMDSGRYENGLKESSWYHFNEDGSIRTIVVYRGGNPGEEYPQNGVFTEYYPDDIKRSEYTYKNGKKNGPFREYYNLGHWVTETETDKYGNTYPVQRLHGTQVKREGQYKDGKLNGEVITWSEKGKMIKKERYANGELVP